MATKRSDEPPCRLDDECAVTSRRLKQARVGKISLTLPIDGVEDPRNKLLLGINAAP
jgi:hypothetical protein